MSNKSPPKKEVFGGYLKECLQHFTNCFNSQIVKGSKKANMTRRPIADFCGVKTSAVATWFRSQNPPVGEVLIKLMCYLDMIGYRVMELEKLGRGHMIRRNFMELVGFGILSGPKAAELIGKVSAPGLYQVFWGREGLSGQKQQLMWDIWKVHREVLEKKKEESWRLYRPRFSLRAIPKEKKSGQQVLTSKAAVIPPNGEKTAVPVGPIFRQKAAVNIMEGLLCLFREGMFENLSESELKILKESPAMKTFFDLSARLGLLCSKLDRRLVKR